MRIIFTITLYFLIIAKIQAQHHEHSDGSTKFNRNHLSFYYGTNIIPKGNPEIDGTLYVPAIGLEYEFWFNSKIGIGTLNDLALNPFVVELSDSQSDDKVHMIRHYVFVTTLVCMFQPIPNLVLYAGPGMEMEADRNLFVQKYGIAYNFHLENDWVIKATASYEDIEVYDTFGIGFAFGKSF